MPKIHPTAIVSPQAVLADDVEIGPWCVLDGPVTLAEGVRLMSHVCINGPAKIGARTQVWPFACLGMGPQDFKFKPGDVTAGIEIGADGLIREHATVHAATNDHTPTRIGDRIFMMAGAHVGHDGQVGDRVTMVNGASFGGHVTVQSDVTFGGSTVAHQFCRVGRLAFVSGLSGFSADVPPFCIAYGRNSIGGVNVVGMRRAGIERAEITRVRRAFRELFRSNVPTGEMLAELDARGLESPCLAEMAEFVRATKRGICPGVNRPPQGFRAWLVAFDRGEVPLEDAGDAL
ncbi:MAG: acyl-ACP--UDP-N-acetylglucosamine O-acyltransferase [Phycisphaerales bacterium JB037]